ncbi:MAG TPA: nucleotidyltransferase domain-containing protein [Candidatus Baltobacteraceae bacterium]|nr:nucleotidyltransferase domain-containing protein [Candidatus Baltobacteraceae bacterium]
MDRPLQDAIHHITNQLVEKYRPEQIILFGSAVRGDWQADSDVDFLAIKRECPPSGRERIRALQRLIRRNVAVDVLVYRPEEVAERLALGDPFLAAILREGKVLYG